MKVLHIGDNVKYGHRFNGHDLGKYLRTHDIDSHHLVWWKNISDQNTSEFAADYPHRDYIRNVFSNCNVSFSSNALFYPFSYELLFTPSFLDSDIVHLHLIHNSFFGIEFLPIITHLKPVVWTLHDPWALSGHCVYPLNCNRWRIGCGECPDLKRTFPIVNDASAINWEYKKIISKASEFDVIVASKWMRERVEASPIFSEKSINLINFGIDLDLFKPSADVSFLKRKLGIDPNNKVIAFRATNSPYKGLEYIKEVLSNLKVDFPITLLTFNETGLLDEFADRFQVVDLGWVSNDYKMIEAYNVADIFIMPSVAEAFGMMAIETMACAKPIIVMDGTALAEVLKPEESGGIVIQQGDCKSLLDELKYLLENPDLCRLIGERSRKVAEKYYSKDRYVSEIIDVYQKVIDQRKNDVRSDYLVSQQKKLGNKLNEVKYLEFPDSVPLGMISNKEYYVVLLIRRIINLPGINFLYLHFFSPIIKLFVKKK